MTTVKVCTVCVQCVLYRCDGLEPTALCHPSRDGGRLFLSVRAGTDYIMSPEQSWRPALSLGSSWNRQHYVTRAELAAGSFSRFELELTTLCHPSRAGGLLFLSVRAGPATALCHPSRAGGRLFLSVRTGPDYIMSPEQSWRPVLSLGSSCLR